MHPDQPHPRLIETPELVDQRIAGANGTMLHVVAAGKSGGLVLFLHGFPEHWLAWKGQLLELGRNCRAVAMDLRGYNLSDKPPSIDAYRMDVLVEDVRTVLHALGPGERAVLVGHDWGGIIAWHFAREYPEMLRRLVIINAPHPAVFARELAQSAAQRRASSYLLLFRQRPLAEWALRSFGFALLRRAVFGQAATPAAFPPEKQAAYLAAWKRPGALTGGLNYYRAAARLPAPGNPNRLWTIEVPTLVLWGDDDPMLLPGNLEGLSAYVPYLRIVRMPGATHWVVHEQPDRVNAELRRVL